MKKYFLLAATALLLGTSNVMAERAGSTTATMNVSVEMVAAPSIEIIQHMDWGTIYFDWNKMGRYPDFGRFEGGDFIKHDSTAAATGQQVGIFRISGDRPFDIVLPSDVYFDDVSSSGLMMANISYTENASGNIVINAQLTGAEVDPTGEHTGSLVITVNYD